MAKKNKAAADPKDEKLQKILERQDCAWSATQDVRERASDDLIFARVTQWDDSLDWCSLEYRGEFNLIWKERQRLISELRANQIAPSFKPVDGADPDSGDIYNGMYRTDMRDNCSKEAIDVATDDVIDAGFGAWRLVTEYVSSSNDMDNRQVIKRMPIHEANNVVFFDGNAKLKDKSDAMWCHIITRFNEEGIDELAEGYGFDASDVTSFSIPSESYVFPWRNSKTTYTVGECYEREKKTEKIVIMEHPIKGVQAFKRSEVKEVLDDMISQGWITLGQKTREYFKVVKYLVTNTKILHGPELVAGEHIPVVPAYGNISRVEGTEIWSGITRLAKDPQRLYNMQMSYLADIAAKGPRRKPIFTPKQVQGLQHMWESQNNYPYYLLNDVDSTGGALPPGPVGYVEPESVPEATVAALQAARRGVEDVTSPGMPQDYMDPEASGKALMAVQTRIDNQSFVYMDNIADAIRRDGVIYASMVKAIFDTEREVTLTDYQGEESKAVIMESIQDMKSGEWVTLNDLTRGRHEVYVDVGPAWQSQKQQSRAELLEIYQTAANPEVQNIVLMQYLMLLDGEQNEMLRKYARRNLLQMGLIEPTTQEDVQYLQQLQAQAQQPDPQAEALAQALQAQAIKDQASAQKAGADSIKALADAERARAETAKVLSETDGKDLENAARLAAILRGDVGRESRTIQ